MAKTTSKMSLRPLQAAARDTVEENREVIGEKLANTLKMLIKESRNAQENKDLKLQLLKLQRDLRMDTSDTKLSAKILKEYNDIAVKVRALGESAASGKVGEAIKEGGSHYVERKHVIELLEEIRDRRSEYNQAFGKFGADFKKGLISFLGPVSPLVHTFQQLKNEYGDEFEKVSNWLGIDKLRNAILLKRLEDRSVRERITSDKAMRQTRDAIKQLGEKIGGKGGLVSKLTDWAMNKGIKPIFEALRKTGIGRVLEKLGRGVIGKGVGLARGALNAGKGLLGKGGSLLSKLLGLGRGGAGKVGGLLGRAGGALGRLLGGVGSKGLGALGKLGGLGVKALGPLGAVVGLGDIFLNSKDKGKTGEDAIGDYLQGATSGAMLGAWAGPVGMAVGGALGLAATAITRNWSVIKDSVSKGWDGVVGFMKDGWNAVVNLKDSMLNSVIDTWDSMRAKIDDVIKWFADNIPGFNALKSGIGSTAASVANTLGNTATAVSGAVSSAAGAALPYAQSAAQSVSNMFGSDSLVGRAASGVAGFVGKLAMPKEEISSAITDAAKATGVDAGYLMATAAQESTFNPNAGAGTSSAKGLFQFTDGTWKEMVDKYGKQYNIGYGDRMDPKKNAIMGALYARDNANGLAKRGFATGPTELYAAHMLGQGGASQLLSAMQKNPQTDAVALLPKAAAANKNVFFNKDGSHKTVAEVYQFMQGKIAGQSAAYSKAISEDKATGTAQVAQSNNDKYDRVQTAKPGANVTVQKPEDKGGGAQSAGATSNSGNSIKHMPMAVGPSPFLVLQSNMIG